MSFRKVIQDYSFPISERHKPNFDVIIAFDFYDGLESGVAIYSHGIGVKLQALGDSRSGMFRSFRCDLLENDLTSASKSIRKSCQENMQPPLIILERRSKFKTMVRDAVIHSSFLGVGSPYFDWFAGFPASAKTLCEAEKHGFKFIHNNLKSYSIRDVNQHYPS